MSKRSVRVFAMLLALALLAAACGSDSDGDTAAATTADDTSADTSTDAAAEEPTAEEAMADDEPTAEEAMADDEPTAEETASAEPADDVAAGSIEELEAMWAEQRQVIIDEIIAGGYGVQDGVLVGPAGYTIDLSKCPADWSDTSGIVDGVINIGHTTAQSGALAAYGNIALGWGAYIDYINANGGIGPDGLQINLVVKDDAYVATQTQELVAELLQSEEPFYISTLGSPNTFATQGTLNDACVPQAFVMTGHQAWGDPVNHPWTSGLQMSYATEALLWGAWIEDNMPAGTTVGALVMDNDFGLAYEQGFVDFAEQSDIIGDVQIVRHDPAAATLTNEITTIAAGNPDVFISMTAGNPCVLAMQEAGRAGLTDSATALFQPSVCKAVSDFMAPSGDAADGWLIFGGGAKDNTDPQYADDTWISWMNSQIDAAGLDSGVSAYATGFGLFGWANIQALLIAAELPGGLTRTNLELAIHSLHMNHPSLIEGITFAMNGNEDAYFVEGSDLSRFDNANQSWILEGGIIDLNGQSPLCPWVAGEGC